MVQYGIEEKRRKDMIREGKGDRTKVKVEEEQWAGGKETTKHDKLWSVPKPPALQTRLIRVIHREILEEFKYAFDEAGKVEGVDRVPQFAAKNQDHGSVAIWSQVSAWQYCRSCFCCLSLSLPLCVP